jgi:hypothetical protein
VKTNYILLFTISIIFFLSCNPEVNNNVCPPNTDPFGTDPYGAIRSHSDCKEMSGKINSQVLNSDECIYYQYFAEYKILYISHINAAFNCEPGKISSKISFKDNNIFIEEHQEKSDARCNCLYDISYELRNIRSDIYFLSISGPIIDGVTHPSLGVYIDLTQKAEDTYCTTRGFYPWSE